jgi:hypothetical protein
MHSSIEYFWIDSNKKSVKIPASQYIDYVFSWVQSILQDEMLFPTKAGSSFTKEFPMTVKMIFKQLFRVFAHVYHAHFDMVVMMEEEAHLNTLFAHFVCFSREFDLVEKKELVVMCDLIEVFEQTGRI